MTSHLVRTCNEHDVELRPLGDKFVCPRGHSCDVDWTMKPSKAAVVAAPPPPAPQEPKPERKAMPQPKKEHPHGSHRRYWQGCRCQPCKDAISQYLRDRKGGTARPRKAKAPKAAPTRKPRVKATLETDLSALAGRITQLRADLAMAEEELRGAIQETVRDVFPGWTLVQEAE